MSTIASVVDGKVVNQTTAEQKAEEAKKAGGGSLDKDAFLQLLVAQMKYQDPLQPTSNTEYISQLATFSELEEMQNVSASMDMSRANALVGQYVFMNEENGFAEGPVDYVVYQGGKVYLSVNEKLYDMDNLDTVADPEYLLATRLADTFATELAKLPKKELLSESHIDDIEAIMKAYDNMTSYQQSYISDETMARFKEVLEVYEILKPSEKNEGEGNEAEGDDSAKEA